MARGGDFLNSSHVDETSGTMNLDLPPELDSMAESFHSPSKHNILPKGAARQKAVSRTPKRSAVQLPNRQTAFGKHEFTPLLQSVQRNTLRKNINDRSVDPTPSRRKSLYDDNSGSLPGDNTDTLSSMDRTLGQEPPLDSSSTMSTPLARLRSGQGGMGIVGDEGALTLKEQEKMIDEMRKENFGLKLKVYFLDDKLKKLGPEYNEQAIKENVDLKIGVATLREELKRYKKSLKDSEKIMSELQKDLNSRRSGGGTPNNSEQIKRLERMIDEKEEDLNGALDDNDKLRAELKELREKGGSEGSSKQLQELRDENEDLRNKLDDLERDLRQSDIAIENKDEELETLQEKAKESQERVLDLEEDNKQLSEEIKSLQLQKGADSEKDKELKAKQRQIEQLEAELQQLRDELEDERTEKNHAERQKDDMEDQLETLRQKNKELTEDKASLEEENENILESESALKEKNRRLEMEVEELRDQVRDKSFSLKSTATERDERLKVLQLQYEELRIKNQNLENDNKSRIEEARRLNKRLQDMKDEFDTEVKALQEQIELLKDDKQGLVHAKADLESELRKAKNELNAAIAEKNLLTNRERDLGSESKDLAEHLEQARKEIAELAALIDQERQHFSEEKTTLESDWKADVQDLEAQTDELKARLKEEQESKARREREWEHEKRQLETRAETLQRNVRSMQDTLDKLQNNESNLYGKEAKLQEAYLAEKSRASRTEESLNRQIQELSVEIQERKRSFEEKVDEVRSLKEELRTTKRSEASLRDKIQELNDEIDVLNIQLEDQNQNVDGAVNSMKAELDAVRQKFNGARDEVLLLERKLVSLESDAQTAKGDLDVEVKAHKQARSDLQDALRRLEGAKREKQQMHEQLVNASTQINSLKLAKMEAEAKKDELQSRITEVQQQVGASRGLDSEKMELRRAKGRLEIELQKATDERDLLAKKASKLEADLEEAFRASRDEEAKLEKQIWDLTNRLSSGSDSSRELASAKRTIARLEQRVEDLLSRSRGAAPAPGDATSLEMEIAVLSDKLTGARKRESDLTKKETMNRKIISDLKQQIDTLERDLQDARNSGNQSIMGPTTPRASLKSDVETLRAKLAASQKDAQDLKIQMKSMERKAMQLESQATSAEHQKELLEQDIQTLREAKDDLQQKIIESTSTAGQLRQRIYSLEKDVQTAKLQNITAKAAGATRSESPHIGVDETERRELHALLKTTTLQLETAQTQLQSRNEALQSHLKREAQLEGQLRILRKERSDLQDNLQNAESTARKLTNKVRKAEQKCEETKKAWETERKLIAQRMKYTENQQVQSAENDHAELMALQSRLKTDTNRHEAELKGLIKQIRYLKARTDREKKFRKDLSFTKEFFLMQVKMFNTCNEAHLQLIEQMGIVPDRRLQDKRPTLKAVALAIIAGIRIWNRNEEWQEARQLRRELDRGLKKQGQRSQPVESVREKLRTRPSRPNGRLR